MGFGSYDESEQEQDTDQETEGEDVTGDIKAQDYRGKDRIEDAETTDMMQHL